MKKYIFDKNYICSFSTKLSAYLIDFVILILLSFLLTFSINKIYQNSNSYNVINTEITLKVEKMNQYTSEAKLTTFDENKNLKSINDMYKDYVFMSILKSYDLHEEVFNKENIKDLHNHEEFKKYESISYENDNLAYFYTRYIPSNEDIKFNFEGKSPEIYYKYLFIKINGVLDPYEFLSDYPTLKSKDAIKLYNYYINDKKENIDVDNALYKIFTTTLSHSAKIFYEFPFYKTLYDQYQSEYQILVNNTNYILIGAYSLSFIITFIIPLFIFKNNQTFGKKIMRIIVISKNDKKLNIFNSILKVVLHYFLSFYTIVLSSIFITGIQSITHVNKVLTSLLIFSFAFVIVDLLVGLFSKLNRSLDDLLTNSITIHARLESSIEE